MSELFKKTAADCKPQARAKTMVKKCDHPRRTSGRHDATRMYIGGYLATLGAALLGAFFLQVIAVNAPDYNRILSGGSTILSPLENAYGYLAVIFGVAVTFGQFYAGHLAPHVTLAAWLDDPRRFTTVGILRYLTIFAMELLGFYLGALYSNFLVGGVAATDGCAEPLPGTGIAAQFLTTLFVKLFVGHIFLLSVKRYKWGPFGALAIALVVSSSILSLRFVTGGSYSLWRYLGIAFVQGGACLTTQTALIELFTFIAAGAINYLLATFLFSRAASSLGMPKSGAGYKSKGN